MCLWWNVDVWLDGIWWNNRPSCPFLFPNKLDSVPISPCCVTNRIACHLLLIFFVRYCHLQICHWLRYLWLLVLVVVVVWSLPGKFSGRPLVDSEQIMLTVLIILRLLGHYSLFCIPCVWVHWVEGVCGGGYLGLMMFHLVSDTPLLYISPLVLIKMIRRYACAGSFFLHDIWWLSQGGWPHDWESAPLFSLFPGLFLIVEMQLCSVRLELSGRLRVHSIKMFRKFIDCFCFIWIECQGVVCWLRPLGRCGYVLWWRLLVRWVLWSGYVGVLELAECVFRVA